ncbi:MAG TPA: hypothetical protein VF847_00075, partial [Candidatus Deferrimicrobiaceae bacterium]
MRIPALLFAAILLLCPAAQAAEPQPAAAPPSAEPAVSPAAPPASVVPPAEPAVPPAAPPASVVPPTEPAVPPAPPPAEAAPVPPASPPAAPPQVPAPPPPAQEKAVRIPVFISMDFTDVEIPVLVKFMSEQTKKNFIFDERVQGKITIISPRKITVEEAYEVFLSVLQVKGFTVIEQGNTL